MAAPVTDLEVVGEGIKPSATPVIDTNKEVKVPQEFKPELSEKQIDTKPGADVSFDDFLAVKSETPKTIVPVPKVEEQKKEEKKEEIAAKPELKKEEPPKVEPKKEEVKKEEPKVDDKDDKRNYDDIPENLRPIFKKLHNDPFNTFKPLVKELETTKAKLADVEKQYTEIKKGALPDNYYEHEKGYILSPDFEKAANTAIRAEQIANHWAAQYEAIRKGEPTWQDINVNPRTGELVLSDPMNVGKDTENKIQGYVNWANQQLMDKQYALRGISEKHSATHKQSVAEVTDFEKLAFKNFDGEKAKEWEPIIKDTINKTFPAAFRNNPLASGYAKALITIQQLGKLVTDLQKNGVKPDDVTKTDDGKVISNDDKKKAGPTAGDLANAGGTNGKKDADDVTIDDFKAVINDTVNYRS